MKKACCFAGHRKIFDRDRILANVMHEVERLITTEGVSEFLVGNYGQFDSICAKAVRRLKDKYPHILLILTVPYLTKKIEDNKNYYYENYDMILIADIPPDIPKKLFILKCNEYMVKKSRFLICFVNDFRGGAAKTLSYAQKQKNINIINVALFRQSS